MVQKSWVTPQNRCELRAKITVRLGQVMCSYSQFAAEIHGGRTRDSQVRNRISDLTVVCGLPEWPEKCQQLGEGKEALRLADAAYDEMVSSPLRVVEKAAAAIGRPAQKFAPTVVTCLRHLRCAALAPLFNGDSAKLEAWLQVLLNGLSAASSILNIANGPTPGSSRSSAVRTIPVCTPGPPSSFPEACHDHPNPCAVALRPGARVAPRSGAAARAAGSPVGVPRFTEMQAPDRNQ